MQVLIPAEEFKKKKIAIYRVLRAHPAVVVQLQGCTIRTLIHPFERVLVEGEQEALESLGLGPDSCGWCGARYGFEDRGDGWSRCKECGGN